MEHDRPPHHHPLPRRSSLCVCCCCCLKFHKAADISQSQPFCGVYGVVCTSHSSILDWSKSRFAIFHIHYLSSYIFICIQCWRRFRDFLGPHKYMPSPKCDSNITGTNPISISLSDVVVLAISWVDYCCPAAATALGQHLFSSHLFSCCSTEKCSICRFVLSFSSVHPAKNKTKYRFPFLTRIRIVVMLLLFLQESVLIYI